MDDQQTQQQPGQSFEPQPQVPQQPAQYQPPQVPQQPVQPQVAPQVAPQYQQPIQQPQYEPQQPPYQPQQNNVSREAASSAPNQVQNTQPHKFRRDALKKIAIVIVAFLLLGAMVWLVFRLINGNKLALVEADGRNASFTIDVPEGWEVSSSFIGESSFINAFPVEAFNGNPSRIFVNRNAQFTTREKFENEVSRRNEMLIGSDAEFNGLEVSDLAVVDENTDNNMGHTVTFNIQKQPGVVANFMVENRYLYNPDGFSIFATFTYTEEYSKLSNTIDDIMASHQEK